MKETIAAAGNVVVPALLVLRAKGYEVTWNDRSCVAESATQRFVADDLITLLGVVAMRESRGPEWRASDAEIESFMAKSGSSDVGADRRSPTLVEPATVRHLDPFVGGTAEVLDYSPSHSRFVLSLKSADRSISGYLVFVFCSRIHAPVWWRIREPRIRATEGGIEFVEEDIAIVSQELIFQDHYRR